MTANPPSIDPTNPMTVQPLVERYLAVISSDRHPDDYAGMDGLILTIARTEEDFARRQNEHEGPFGDFWVAGTQRKLCARLSASEVPPDPGYEFVGHDVGNLHMSGGVYSLIVHYLLGNRPSGSAGFVLNDYLLLDTREAAIRLLAEWSEWTPADEGAKEVFDDDDVIQAYAIFKARNWQGLNLQ